MTLKVLLIIAIVFLLFFKTKRNLHMLQQNLYNENKRYIKWLVKNREQFMDIELIIIGVLLIESLVLYDIKYFTIIVNILLIVLNVIVGFSWKKKIDTDQNKKPLVVTKRIKRLIFTTSVLYAIPFYFIIVNINDSHIMWKLLLLEGVMVYLNAFIIFMANVINKPIEKLVYLYYKSKAKNKLRSMNNLKVIGVTGSYGKTSCKNVLSDILNIKYNALATPKNLNTDYGLMMTINNNLDRFTDVFIAEMGAYVRGDIKKLCDFVKPKYGIITTIGTAHLESFGSEENIIKAKFELIESLPSDGFAVLNGDDPKQINYKLKNKVKTIWIGINNHDVDVRALNIESSHKGTSFDVVFRDDKNKYHFETKLLGEHNVYNILAAIACGREFGISYDELSSAVSMVRPIEHRLELKKIGNFYQIDDAYNSNPVGAKNACLVLGMMKGIKIVVTPGMVELGEKEEYYNRQFGEEIAGVADYAVLIGEKKTKPIYEGLLRQGFDKDKIIVFNDVREAYAFINSIYNGKEDIYALFENDLPDTYNE